MGNLRREHSVQAAVGKDNHVIHLPSWSKKDSSVREYSSKNTATHKQNTTYRLCGYLRRKPRLPCRTPSSGRHRLRNSETALPPWKFSQHTCLARRYGSRRDARDDVSFSAATGPLPLNPTGVVLVMDWAENGSFRLSGIQRPLRLHDNEPAQRISGKEHAKTQNDPTDSTHEKSNNNKCTHRPAPAPAPGPRLMP